MTRKLTIEQEAIGFNENAKTARQGGRAAGDARRAAEIHQLALKNDD